MKFWMRSAAVGAAVLVFVGLFVHRPGGRPGGAHARDQGPTGEEPDPATRTLMARVGVKRRITDELIAGRLTLLEAVAAFREADAQGPPTMVMFGFPQSSSLDEAYCRSVMSYVSQQAPPDRVEPLTRDLEAELSARLRDGRLRLSDP